MEIDLIDHNSLKLNLTVFDFDKHWKQVEPVLNDPLALRALDAGMKMRAEEIGKEWTRDKGPWEFGQRPSRSVKKMPKPNTPNWYRIKGCHYAISPWSAAVGQLLFPDHDWEVSYNYGLPWGCGHSAGVGVKDGERKSVIIMDILSGHLATQDKKKERLMRLLLASPTFSYPVDYVIKTLKSGL